MAINYDEEKKYLEILKAELKQEADKLFDKMIFHSDGYQKSARYLWEKQSEFDEYEMAFNQTLINSIVDAGEQTREQFKRILKMIDSPYFSRIDFLIPGEMEPMKVYIGKFPFFNVKSDCQIFDWRAPVCSMYYEFEDGPAYYDAPAGRIEGEITCKRQYQISRGELEYVIESNINIDDEILRQELAKNSDHRMKDIVVTIQKEQNCLIRNESAEVLIIQGAAGSGKTSIALHRIAYFLYRYRNEISAKNFLIISPNGIFVDYISGVLPELGEEPIRSLGLEQLAAFLLPKELKWERLSIQAERFLWTGDEEWKRRCQFKSTPDFLRLLEEYFIFCDEHLFSAADYNFENGVVEAELIRKLYDRRKNLPIRQRLDEMASAIREEIRARNLVRARGTQIRDIKEWLENRIACLDALELYREFYRHIGREELFMYDGNEPLESADVFPLLYVKLYLEGNAWKEDIKYLIIDEMQDYTPVQYAVLNKLYPCQKTILGDFAQNIAPFAGSSLNFLRQLYPWSQTIEIRKSYRSTYEIMTFARLVGGNVDIEPVKRHGEEPQVIIYKGQNDLKKAVRLMAEDSLMQGKGKLGIICKSATQAQALYHYLKENLTVKEQIHLLTPDSQEFYEGAMVMSVAMSKGLEFDEVVIVDADDENFHTEYERGLLYVACTRAMHRLTIIYSGMPSRFLPI